MALQQVGFCPRQFFQIFKIRQELPIWFFLNSNFSATFEIFKFWRQFLNFSAKFLIFKFWRQFLKFTAKFQIFKFWRQFLKFTAKFQISNFWRQTWNLKILPEMPISTFEF